MSESNFSTLKKIGIFALVAVLVFGVIYVGLSATKKDGDDETSSSTGKTRKTVQTEEDVKKAEELIDRLINNLNNASEFLTDEEKKIKEKTKELNNALTI